MMGIVFYLEIYHSKVTNCPQQRHYLSHFFEKLQYQGVLKVQHGFLGKKL